MDTSKPIGPVQNVTGSALSVFLIDAHALTRSCIASLLVSADRKIQVHGCPCIVGADAMLLPRIDLVLWNIGALRITDGAINADLHTIHQKLPDVPLVVFSKHNDAAQALGAIRLGARGYIPASLSLPVMIAALRLIMVGGVYIAPVSTEALGHTANESVLTSTGGHQPSQARGGLTNREEEVLALLRQGKPNKLIAYELRMSENTVKVHVRRIIKKLHVMNRTEAAYACDERVRVDAPAMRWTAHV